MERAHLTETKRLVVKVGTSTITHHDGALNLENIEHLCRMLVNQKHKGREVVLVTSGAIAVGLHRLRLRQRPESLREKQAIAAIGQVDLMNIYSRFLAEYDQNCAQILMTRGDVDDPQTLENITNTFDALLELDVLPIVNENDTVSTTEVMFNGTFGDNDSLSAIVARIVHADTLILLSDIEGLYDCDPHLNEDARFISTVEAVDEDIMLTAGGQGSWRGTGGMISKLNAAKVASAAGIDMIITHGNKPNDVNRILDGEEIGTWFIPQERQSLEPGEMPAEDSAKESGEAVAEVLL